MNHCIKLKRMIPLYNSASNGSNVVITIMESIILYLERGYSDSEAVLQTDDESSGYKMYYRTRKQITYLFLFDEILALVSGNIAFLKQSKA